MFVMEYVVKGMEGKQQCVYACTCDVYVRVCLK